MVCKFCFELLPTNFFRYYKIVTVYNIISSIKVVFRNYLNKLNIIDTIFCVELASSSLCASPASYSNL
ncbi:hypothetical protein BpHYR1_044079 [Brachionus plicatilis]|uniref:Uncharacterized protein n=1 Tax=Brachionus plicatilis TaxID=10195 RepID=A0A3M7PGF5_BRAPC|nr:hypothetical protein BpHYR1_044079 [Brachionus plicatilis]